MKTAKQTEYSVTTTKTSPDADPITTVLFSGLRSEQEAWEAGHTWLMERESTERLDIRHNGKLIGDVSYER